MPHSIKEQHLNDICAQCKQPHGNSTTLENANHKWYEIITCQSCGYEIVRVKEEEKFTSFLDAVHLK
jgi:DNA-directed RNA polymerase subunit RPC12/RpoP